MDYFEVMRAKMEKKYGLNALQHPHPGTIGVALTAPQALASINPSFQDPQAYSHIVRDYSTPITLSEEPIIGGAQDMDVD